MAGTFVYKPVGDALIGIAAFMGAIIMTYMVVVIILDTAAALLTSLIEVIVQGL